MIPKSERVKLHFGPYRTPQFKVGAIVRDEIRGEVRIIGMSDSRIPWPLCTRGKNRYLAVTGDLVRAIRRESRVAISYWWGVSLSCVQSWRRALNAPIYNEGTHRLQLKHAYAPANKRKLRKAALASKTPESLAKLSAALKGRKRPEHLVRATAAAHIGIPRSLQTRQKISETYKRIGRLPPLAVGRVWSAREDEFVRTLSPDEAAEKTGRTKKAVYHRRHALKLSMLGRNRFGEPKKTR